MRAVNCPSFRLLCKNYGAGYVTTQAFHTWELDAWKDRLDTEFSGQDSPLCVQVLGNQPADLHKAVRILNPHADIVELNAGCPYNDVCGKKSGAFLLLHLSQLERAVNAVMGATNKPVTVKIRTGWTPELTNVVEVVRLLENLGVAAIIVHARARSELFKGHAHWDLVRQAKRACEVPIIGNGDVKTPANVEAMLTQTKCEAVMIGRAAMGKPFIFKQVQVWLDEGWEVPQTFDQQKALFLDFARYYHKFERDRSPSEFRDHALWFLKGFTNIRALVAKIRKLEGIEAIERIIRDYKNPNAILAPSFLRRGKNLQ